MKNGILLGLSLGFAVGAWGRESQDLLRQGLEHLNAGRSGQALDTLRRATQADATDSSAQTALGLVALQNQRYDEARAALERAVGLNPRSQTALFALAMLYEKIERFPDARASWQRLIALSPSKELQEMAQRHLDRLQ